MPLIHMSDMLGHAYRNGYAVGAFDLVSLDFLTGILAAAERCRAPVILSLRDAHFEHDDFELLMAACVVATRRTPVPMAIHLDHGAGMETAVRAIRAGCNGVMVDTSALPLDENLRLTREVVAMAHACGVAVEGELGCASGTDGEDAQSHPAKSAYTSPEEAKDFVARSGVDCLAVSIGAMHGRTKGIPLDFARLGKINEAVGLPLVILGGSGLSNDQFRKLIASGVAKINCHIALAEVAGADIRERVRRFPFAGYTQLVAGVNDAVRGKAERMIRLWGGSGRAADVLARCRPWRENDAAIASYRDHPDHLRYADGVFRPAAPERLTIDYEIDG